MGFIVKRRLIVEQVKFMNAIESNFGMIFIDVIWLPYKT